MLVSLRGVARSYGAIRALAGVSAEIAGDVVGLLGPNGAGKSTMLKAMLGLIEFEGEARVLGLDPRNESFRIRDRVGYMPEADSYLAGLTAVELCSYAGELSGLPRTEAMQRAHAALYYAGLEEKRYLKVEGYSTGMKQKVKLAQALVHDPELLFLDEPTNGLDPRAREDMLELIQDLPKKRGCAVLLSTHLLPDVDRIADHALIMHQGQIRFTGTIEALRARPREGGEVLDVEVKADPEPLALRLEGAGCQVRRRPPVGLVVELPACAATGLVLREARAVGAQVRRLEANRESLEQAFLRVIADDAPAAGAVVSAADGPYRAAAAAAPEGPRAAIHDLGYKRYLGTRRPQSSRWRVIVRNQVSVAWRGFWRLKAWAIGAVIVTVVFGSLMYVAGAQVFEELASRTTGSPTTMIDAMLPFSFNFFPLLGFILSISVGAATVSRDLKAGAFEFYFSRPVRPVDYVLGKFVGLFLITCAVMAAGPLLLALFRIGIAKPAEMLGLLDVVPRALAVGVLGAAAYAALPLACGALVARPGHAIAVWVALYMVAGNIISVIAQKTGTPMLGVLVPSDAIVSMAFDLFDITLVKGKVTAPAWAGAAALAGHTALGLALTLWRVRRAERAGLGGG